MSQLLTINLSKGPGVSWGFRLQGGKDFAQPLCIQKVTPGSVSAQAGVQSGDAIVRIGAEDALSLRHKEAQDAIIRAGNSFVMQVQRGTITWKPAVTALAQPKQTPEGPVATQTSLAAAGKGLAPTKRAPKGFNAVPAGFNASAETPNGSTIAPTQYNSPIGLYTDENIAEALTAQAEVINPQAAGANKGCLGINFRKFEREIKLRTDSPTYQMLHGDDSAAAPKQRKQLPPPEEEEEKPVFPTPQPGKQVIHNAGSQVAAPTPPMPKPIRSVQAPITNTENISVNKTATLCHMCDRPIVGVFVRIKDKNMHAECFKCNTCGSSLKNVGYYNVNDKLYCDTHAKQAAAANPPAPNLVPVTVKP